MAPGFNVAEREGDECVRQKLEQLSSEAGVGSYADCATEADTEERETSFVDVVGSMDIEAGVESEELPTSCSGPICGPILC